MLEIPEIPKIGKKVGFWPIAFVMNFGLRPDSSQDILGGPHTDPGPAGRPQTLKTDVRDLERSGRIWQDLAGSGTIWIWYLG